MVPSTMTSDTGGERTEASEPFSDTTNNETTITSNDWLVQIDPDDSRYVDFMEHFNNEAQNDSTYLSDGYVDAPAEHSFFANFLQQVNSTYLYGGYINVPADHSFIANLSQQDDSNYFNHVGPTHFGHTAPLNYYRHSDEYHLYQSLSSRETQSDTVADVRTEPELPISKHIMEDNIASTDSGYESAKGHIYPSMPEDIAGYIDKLEHIHSNATNDKDRSCTNASYSSATTILPEFAQKCIFDICNNINSRLEGMVKKRALTSVSKRLPGLIRAFAIKLGSDMPDPWNLRVMYFIHRHQQYIVSHLQTGFCRDENKSMSSVNPGHDMPSNDILSMWYESDIKYPVAMDRAEYSQDTKDEDDVENDVEDDAEDGEEDLSLLPEYSQTILKSAAYEWLISSLIREASFCQDGTQPQTMIEQIRHEILSQLPNGRISSKRPPHRHTVSFKIPRSSLPFFVEDASDSMKLNSPTAISDRIVATSASTCSVQVSKVSQYMDQTWPLGGGALLSALQNTINGTIRANSSASEGTSKIEVTLDSFYLEVFVTGTSYSIAEYGEQLAWLIAALQPAVSDHAVYVRPSMWRADDRLTMDGIRHNWIIELWRERIDEADVTAYSMQDWLGGPNKAVIVHGFPTMPRPENCPGIELARQLIVSLLPIPLPVLDGTRYLLFTTQKVLQLFRQTKGVNIWHILGSAKDVCTCRQRFLRTDDKDVVVSLDPVDISQRRHIVTNCSVMEMYYRDTEAVEGLTSGISKLSHRESSRSEEPILSSSSDSITGILCSSDSMDADMLSIPETSENSMDGCQDIDDAYSSTVEGVATRLLFEYREQVKYFIPSIGSSSNTKHCGPGQSQEVASQGNSQNTLQVSITQHSSTESSRKRLAADDKDSDDDDSERLPRRKKPQLHDSGKGPQFFACPFWKQNPGKHSNCFGKKLNMISRVKQHLDRKHSPEYCDRCLAVFPNEVQKLAHLRDEQALCRFHQWAPLDGLTSEQRRKLSRKSDSRLSESQKWFVVWDIVFPGLRPPSSPYLDLELSQDLNHFREFSERRALAVFIEVFHDEGLVVPGDSEREALVRRAVTRGMSLLSDQWLIDRATTFQNSTSEGSSSADAPGVQQYDGRQGVWGSRVTDQSSNADSGVELRSQLSSGASREDSNLPSNASNRPQLASDGGSTPEPFEMTNRSVSEVRAPSIGASPSPLLFAPLSTDTAHFNLPPAESGSNHFDPQLPISNLGAEWPGNFAIDFDMDDYIANLDDSRLEK